jgi:hypothetical protein
LLLLAGTCDASDDPRAAPSPTPTDPRAFLPDPVPTPNEPSLVQLRLVFDSPATRPVVRYRIPYQDFGCPCATDPLPTSLDVADHGRLMVLDEAGGRVVVFDRRGRFRYGTSGRGIGRRSVDVQWMPFLGVVMSRRRNEGARFTMYDRAGSASTSAAKASLT